MYILYVELNYSMCNVSFKRGSHLRCFLAYGGHSFRRNFRREALWFYQIFLLSCRRDTNFFPKRLPQVRQNWDDLITSWGTFHNSFLEWTTRFTTSMKPWSNRSLQKWIILSKGLWQSWFGCREILKVMKRKQKIYISLYFVSRY